jgi:hypothetical protein
VPTIPNQPPVAVAGPDQVFVDFDSTGSATITVDGSASFDPDGSIGSYAWLEGETLLGTSPVLTTSLVTSGDHRLVLNVTDNGGLTRGAVVTARVELVESTVQLLFEGFTSGLGSWEVDGDAALVNDTTFPDPPQVRIGASGSSLRNTIAMSVGSTGMTVSFWGKASQFSAGGELLVKLSVDGGPFTTIHTITSAASNDTYIFYGGSAIPIAHSWFPATASNIVLEFESNTTTGLFFVDLVKVKALLAPPGSQPPIAGKLPIANAGADTTVDDNDSDGFELVTLDGSLSGDPDGSIATYEWFEVTSSGTSLLGTGATLDVSFARRAVPGVLGPEISGSHTVQLVVTDNDGGTASDTVVVTVNQALAGNQPPVANAGLDKTITDFDGDTQEFVLLDGRASADADGSIVSYVWTENGNVLSNVPGAGILQEGQLKIILPIGVHTIELTVTDNQAATGTDTVVIRVVATSCVNDMDCDDGLFCNGAETCDAQNDCQPGTAVAVDDGVGCTDDSCDEVGNVVVNAVNNASCDNGQFCDGSETCDAINDCQAGTPVVLDDSVACTVDACDEVGDVLSHLPDAGACDDGDPCTAEVCDAVAGCSNVAIDNCPAAVPAGGPGGVLLLSLLLVVTALRAAVVFARPPASV